MSDTKDALDRARSEAQELHKKVEANTTKSHAALRTDIKDAAAKAQSLAASLRTVLDGQHADAKQHIKNAAAELDDASKNARDIASASEEQLRKTNLAILEKVRDAAQDLSYAVASQRAAIAKV